MTKERPELEVLLAQLEQARAELRRAEREAWTELVHSGVVDQTRLDLTTTLRRIAAEGRGEP